VELMRTEDKRASFAALLDPFRTIIREFSKFGVVGLIALVVDVGLFNLLMFAGSGILDDKPLTAKAIAVVAATAVSYGLNRNWTFSHRGGRSSRWREYGLFFGLYGVAMLITLSVLWFSHYALGLDSVLADNISANVIGLGLGTVFRFWSYRKWVFPAQDDTEPAKAPSPAV
jgi:putative flippase GtrA